jgi:hypothetical protein
MYVNPLNVSVKGRAVHCAEPAQNLLDTRDRLALVSYASAVPNQHARDGFLSVVAPV